VLLEVKDWPPQSKNKTATTMQLVITNVKTSSPQIMVYPTHFESNVF
jgi:hypothetical protein